MNLNKVFNDFCEMLSARAAFTSEDTIRYYWFASMQENDKFKDLNHYVLEQPYDDKLEVFEHNSKNAKKELDLLYNSEEEQWAIEIKFHRYSPGSSYVHTDAAGSIFNDLFRLQYAPVDNQTRGPIIRLFLYITDNEMNDYFSAEKVEKAWQNKTFRKELHRFYTMPEGTSSKFDFLEENLDKTDKNDHLPPTFRDKAFDSFNTTPSYFSSPLIRLLYKKDNIPVPDKNKSFKDHVCHVRLYEVLTSASNYNVENRIGN